MAEYEKAILGWEFKPLPHVTKNRTKKNSAAPLITIGLDSICIVLEISLKNC